MLLLNPRKVTFGEVTWGNVASVAIGRSAHRMLVEWSDSGPHAVLADVSEQRVRVEVVQELLGEDMDTPKPGESGALAFTTAPTSTDLPSRELTMTAVVESVSYEVSLRRGSVRRVVLVATSIDGGTDPVAVDDA
ncbi:MAG: hypothetical protein DHS20C14_14900 [Phycisphaeraceae bacterium]|nr:MAG: hypothetical protein DHS20C14_14900 [Phycisphaeraceae bacterium]